MHLKNLIALFLLLSGTMLFAQDVKQEIAKEFTAYQDAIASGEFETAMEHVTPEFFSIYPKKDIISLMEKTYNNPDITFEIKDMKIENIEDTEEIDGKHYALLSYSNLMNIKFAPTEGESEENKKSRIGMTRISLEQTFGSNNVSYDPSTDFFGVKASKSVYAISENGKTNWKFLVVEKGQEEVLRRLLPQQLVNKM